MHRIILSALLAALTLTAQATPIRVEFETNFVTAYDSVNKVNVAVEPIIGKFSIEFDDSQAQWDRDEWGPYFQFDMGWIETPVTPNIPWDRFFSPIYYGQSSSHSFTLGLGGMTDSGAVYDYGPGYADQTFSFYQRLNRSSIDASGRQVKDYTLSIDFRRVSPIESFKVLSNLEFLRSFVGHDLAGGTAVLTEVYQFQQYVGGVRVPYEGLRYMDSALKVTAVIDESRAIPEPGTILLVLIGLAMMNGFRFRTKSSFGKNLPLIS